MSIEDCNNAACDTFTGTALSLSPNWTTTPPTLTNEGNVALLANAQFGFYWNSYWYPFYQVIHHGPWVEYRDRRPIRLTMDEVERLRVATKKDGALKNILEKFTDHIEVIVDFGKLP